MSAILTHRGLEPDNPQFMWGESTFEAFQDQSFRGFGLEFDCVLLKDGQIAVFHDSTVERISGGKDMRSFASITAEELSRMHFTKGRICLLKELLTQVSTDRFHAIHIKARCQTRDFFDTLSNEIREADERIGKQLLPHLIAFDLTIESAERLKAMIPQLQLAASVSHPYDVERYGAFTGGTLLTVDQLKSVPGLYSWAWLDEWDRTLPNGGEKEFYTEDTFNAVCAMNLKIAVVSPELHATSPGLLGGEQHQDAETKKRLFERLTRILSIRPDAICTDFPEDVRRIMRDAVESSRVV